MEVKEEGENEKVTVTSEMFNLLFYLQAPVTCQIKRVLHHSMEHHSLVVCLQQEKRERGEG